MRLLLNDDENYDLSKVTKKLKLEPEDLLEVLTERCSNLVDKQLSALETLGSRIEYMKGK